MSKKQGGMPGADDADRLNLLLKNRLPGFQPASCHGNV
jgi:hypothetical protein